MDLATPRLDALREEAVELREYYAAPTCSPARAALLTGRHPVELGLQHDIIQNGQDAGLPEGVATLAEALGESGYDAHAVGKWHTGFARDAYLPHAKGFDPASFLGFLSGSGDHYRHITGPYLDWRDGTEPRGQPWPNSTPTNCPTQPPPKGRPASEEACERSYTTINLTARAVEIIERHAGREAPLFLYFAPSAPHWPLGAPDRLTAPFESTIKDPWRRAYAGMVLGLDEAVANITEALRSARMWDNTLLVFGSDNGGMSQGYDGPGSTCGGLNFPHRGWKDSLWEGGVRALALARLPGGARGGTQYDGLFHIADWMPTIVHAATGAAPPRSGYGVDHWGALQGRAPFPRQDVLLNVDTFTPPARAGLRAGRWKLVVEGQGRETWGFCRQDGTGAIVCPDGPPKDPDDDPGAALGWPGAQLFDLEAGAGEAHDVAASHPRVLEALLGRLTELNATAVPAQYPPIDPRWDPKLRGGVLGPWLPDNTRSPY